LNRSIFILYLIDVAILINIKITTIDAEIIKAIPEIVLHSGGILFSPSFTKIFCGKKSTSPVAKAIEDRIDGGNFSN
jgi:hypothetical protein